MFKRKAMGISLFLLMPFLFFLPWSAQASEARVVKNIEGRVISRYGLLALITKAGKGYILRQTPKREKAFEKVKEWVNQDADLIIKGKETAETRQFERIKYDQDDKELVQREEYSVFEVVALRKVIQPSKITQEELKKFLIADLPGEKSAEIAPGGSVKVPSPEAGKIPEVSPGGLSSKEPGPALEGPQKITQTTLESKASTPAVSTAGKSVGITTTQIGPSILQEVEGKITAVEPEHYPLRIKVKSTDTKETMTILVPRGIGILNKSEKAEITALKVGVKVDIWYREIKEDNIAEMISIF